MDLEKGLVERLILKDDLAFAQFYEQSIDNFFRYWKAHYRIDDSEISDILADAYLKIWNNMDKYDPAYKFEQFAWTIVKNQFKDYFKKKKPLFFSEFWDENSDASDILTELIAEDDVSDFFQQKFDSEQIMKALGLLDELSQEVVHARYVLAYSYETISYLYSISVENARKKVSRALKKIRKLLQ